MHGYLSNCESVVLLQQNGLWRSRLSRPGNTDRPTLWIYRFPPTNWLRSHREKPCQKRIHVNPIMLWIATIRTLDRLPPIDTQRTTHRHLRAYRTSPTSSNYSLPLDGIFLQPLHQSKHILLLSHLAQQISRLLHLLYDKYGSTLFLLDSNTRDVLPCAKTNTDQTSEVF